MRFFVNDVVEGYVDSETSEGFPEDWNLERLWGALKGLYPVSMTPDQLEEAAGGPVEGFVGAAEPLDAIQDAVNLRGFDEIIISTLPARVSRWMRLDLPHKVAGLGLPVTTITAKERAPSGAPA